MRWPCSISILALASCHDGSSPAEAPRTPSEAVVAPLEPDASEPAARFARSKPDCVDAPFVEPGPPRDEGWTMTSSHADTRVGTATCMKGREVWRDGDGNVRACTIAKPVRKHGLDLAGENYTLFHADGRPYQTHLAREHMLRGGDGTEYRCTIGLVVLDPKGVLEHCTLAATTKVGAITCRHDRDIALHPEGELASCEVDERVEALGAVFAAGTWLGFHRDGALARAALNDPMYVAGWLVDQDLEADDAGRLTHFTLAEKRTVGGIALPERARVWLHADGSPWHVEYIADEGFMIHGEPWSDTRDVTFDCAGRIVADTTEHYQAPSRPHR
jgi:hypothetical protein